MLDVGACFGTHSLAFSGLVGTSGRVIAFEASPTNFSLLHRNCAAQQGGPIQPVLAVVATTEGGRFVFDESDENYGATSAKPMSEAAMAAGGQDQVLSLSIDSLQLRRADFIKIDVEGAESAVLVGASETIRRCRPVIFFEVNFIQEAINALDQLKAYDYHFFGVITSAFNPNNFLGNACDIFHGDVECGIFGVPNSRYEALCDVIAAARIATIKTADDIALLLMNKPQYVGMDITRELAARSLKVPAIVANANGFETLQRQLASQEHGLAEATAKLEQANDRNKVALRQANWQNIELARLNAETERRQARRDGQDLVTTCWQISILRLFPRYKKIPQNFASIADRRH